MVGLVKYLAELINLLIQDYIFTIDKFITGQSLATICKGTFKYESKMTLRYKKSRNGGCSDLNSKNKSKHKIFYMQRNRKCLVPKKGYSNGCKTVKDTKICNFYLSHF